MLERKGEHNIDILDHMENEYTALGDIFQNCRFISTDNSIEESVKKVILEIWRKYIENSV